MSPDAPRDEAYREAPFVFTVVGIVLWLGGTVLLTNGLFALTRYAGWPRVGEVIAGGLCLVGMIVLDRFLRTRKRRGQRR